MRILAMLSVIALAAWIVSVAHRSLLASGRSWNLALILLMIAGLALGCWLLGLTYYESPTLRPSGYPFPVAAAEFFDGKWHGGLIYHYMWLALTADIAVGVLAFIAPFRLMQWLVQRQQKSNENAPDRG